MNPSHRIACALPRAAGPHSRRKMATSPGGNNHEKIPQRDTRPPFPRRRRTVERPARSAGSGRIDDLHHGAFPAVQCRRQRHDHRPFSRHRASHLRRIEDPVRDRNLSVAPRLSAGGRGSGGRDFCLAQDAGIKAVGDIKRIEYTIGLSRKKMDEKQAEKFNAALRGLIRNGTVKAIVEKYGMRPAP